MDIQQSMEQAGALRRLPDALFSKLFAILSMIAEKKNRDYRRFAVQRLTVCVTLHKTMPTWDIQLHSILHGTVVLRLTAPIKTWEQTV